MKHTSRNYDFKLVTTCSTTFFFRNNLFWSEQCNSYSSIKFSISLISCIYKLIFTDFNLSIIKIVNVRWSWSLLTQTNLNTVLMAANYIEMNTCISNTNFELHRNDTHFDIGYGELSHFDMREDEQCFETENSIRVLNPNF